MDRNLVTLTGGSNQGIVASLFQNLGLIDTPPGLAFETFKLMENAGFAVGIYNKVYVWEGDATTDQGHMDHLGMNADWTYQLVAADTSDGNVSKEWAHASSSYSLDTASAPTGNLASIIDALIKPVAPKYNVASALQKMFDNGVALAASQSAPKEDVAWWASQSTGKIGVFKTNDYLGTMSGSTGTHDDADAVIIYDLTALVAGAAPESGDKFFESGGTI